jgi:hypothetical protein
MPRKRVPESVEVIREGLGQWQTRQNKLRKEMAQSRAERELVAKAQRMEIGKHSA